MIGTFLKYSLLASLPILGIAFCPNSASAAAHDHCKTSAWTSELAVEPGLYPAATVTEATFLLKAPPPSGTDECGYEVSDITSLSFIFDYNESSLALDLVEFMNGTDAEWFATNLTLPFSIPDNVLITPFIFDQHQTNNPLLQGPLEQNLSGAGTFGLKFSTTAEANISSGKATLKGTHYYLKTNVPGPLPLLGVGAAFGFSRKLRKRIKSSKTPEVMSAID